MAHDARYGAGPAGRVASAGTEGVLTRRLLAYLIDLVVIFGLTIALSLPVGIAGLMTLGAAWVLYAFLIPATAIFYSTVTVGGGPQATIGMRLMGIAAQDVTGGRVTMLVAAVHALLFYVGIWTLLLLILDIAIGIARADRRLGHDLLAGLVFVRR